MHTQFSFSLFKESPYKDKILSADFIFSYIFHYSASGSRDTFLLSAYRGVTQGVVSVIVGLIIGVGEGVCAKIAKKSWYIYY